MRAGALAGATCASASHRPSFSNMNAVRTWGAIGKKLTNLSNMPTEARKNLYQTSKNTFTFSMEKSDILTVGGALGLTCIGTLVAVRGISDVLTGSHKKF